MTNVKDGRFFLLDTIPTDDDKKIKGSKLPTTHQVLLCFLAHHKTLTKREAANKTVEISKHIYDCARIPTLQHKMAEEVEKLFNDMKNIIKIQPRNRTSGKQNERLEEFRRRLQTTMKFWPRNAMEKIDNEEDKKFLLSMINDRKATMAGIDKKLSLTEENVMKRKEQKLRRVGIE